MRNVIFISHATPQDNEFSIWLASRLQMMGYDVWIDRNALLGGEKFWELIDQVLRHKTIRFLLVYSQNILFENQPGILKDGIYKEISLAESIGKQEHLIDLMILLNIDRSNYNLFIGADRLNQINFYHNWADGLKQLLNKLEKDNIQKTDQNTSLSLASWYENVYTTKGGIIDKKELYYTCWWPIKQLPKYFYMFQFESEGQAVELHKRKNQYPVAKATNILSTFDPDFNLEIDYKGDKFCLKPKSKHELNIDDILRGDDKNDFPSHADAENHLKYLLNRVFHQIMRKRGLDWYQMANKRLAYFFTPANLESWKLSFEYPYRKGGKQKTKNLIGKYLSLGNWHFAVSNKTILTPIIAFSLKSHITFTNNGYKVWDDKDKIHSHRRSKGKKFFNEEWRDMLCAFLHGLKDRHGKIEIELNKSFLLTMEPWTESYWSDFGYFEPKEKDRQSILDYYNEIELDQEELLKAE